LQRFLRSFLPVAFPAAVLILLLVSLSQPWRAGRETTGERPAPAETLLNAVGAERRLARYRASHVTLGDGGTLAAALERLSIPRDQRVSIVETAGREIDLRRLPPRTGLIVIKDLQDRVVSVGLRPEAERFLRLSLPRRDPRGPIRTEWIAVAVETSIATAEGVVESSLAQAFGHAAHGLQLTLAFADVFQWDVDLLVDPRPGDRVQVVYELRTLGQLPRDLPRFGEETGESGEFMALGRILAATYQGSMARSSAFWVGDDEGIGNYYDMQGRPLRKSFLKSPLNYRRISSGFSRARRHPVTQKVVPHHGVDYVAAPGTPVSATADGRVISAGWDGALGKAVRIRHGSEYVTIYGHLRGVAKGIRSGADVRQNQVIGYVGSTGRTTGPHLHFTLLHRGSPINPLKFKSPSADPLPPAMEPLLEIAKRKWLPLLDAIRPEESDLELAKGDEAAGKRS
jgi:murein DD-endopeptidase MepM/ murein hydrolase activator NlpD